MYRNSRSNNCNILVHKFICFVKLYWKYKLTIHYFYHLHLSCDGCLLFIQNLWIIFSMTIRLVWLTIDYVSDYFGLRCYWIEDAW